LYGCSSTRTVPAGDALYTGAKVTIKDTEESRKKRKALRGELEGLTRPRPNQKVLGIPLKLNIYNAFRAKKGPGKWIREKFGQPPVLLSAVSLNNNVQVLNNYLINKGYFNARTTGDTTIKPAVSIMYKRWSSGAIALYYNNPFVKQCLKHC
jgi:hypothetical protein